MYQLVTNLTECPWDPEVFWMILNPFHQKLESLEEKMQTLENGHGKFLYKRRQQVCFWKGGINFELIDPQEILEQKLKLKLNEAWTTGSEWWTRLKNFQTPIFSRFQKILS